MKNLSSWLITIFIIAFWIFRVIVTVAAGMGKVFVTSPIDYNIEIALLFVTLGCVPFIFKRKLFGSIIYLGCNGWYFGRGIFQNVMLLIKNTAETKIPLQTYTDMLIGLVGIALGVFALFDILLDKNRTNHPVDKKTDWFYKNEQYDRELDDRADKNNYRTL